MDYSEEERDLIARAAMILYPTANYASAFQHPGETLFPEPRDLPLCRRKNQADHSVLELMNKEMPEEILRQYVAKRVHDERWNAQLPHLCKALEIIAEYRGRGQELIDQMSTELDLG